MDRTESEGRAVRRLLRWLKQEIFYITGGPWWYRR